MQKDRRSVFNIMADVAHEDSVLPRPVQEEGYQKTAAALLNLLQDLPQSNPGVVLHLFRHWQQLNPDGLNLLGADANPASNPDVLNQSLRREKAKGSKFQAITSSLLAAASGSYSGARLIFIFLLNTLFGVVKMKPEIPRERHAELDEIKSSLEEVQTKQKKVQHDTGKMEEKIQTAIENDFKISCNDNKELEIGLVTARCDLDSCQDILSCDVRDAINGLQLRAKEAIASVHKLLAITRVVIIGTVFVVALAAVLHHWGGPAKERLRDRRFYYHDDGDDDVKENRSMTAFVVTGCLIMTVIVLVICKQKAQSLINNQKLLTECEELQKNGLQNSERFQKDLNRDVEYKLPHWKKQLAVLDINVSLYASLHSHSE